MIMTGDEKILQLIDFWFRIPFSISFVLSLTANNALCAKSALGGRSNKIFTVSVIPFLAGGPGIKSVSIPTLRISFILVPAHCHD